MTALRVFCVLVMAALVVGCDRGDTAGSDEIVEVSGEEVFLRRCSSCHGREGRGDGPASRAYARVADLTQPGVVDKYRAQDLELLITNGAGDMPPVRGFRRGELEAVVEYIQSLPVE